uniref:Uncharacterized protein n=1 Tax=viral metagenome TaxID=1070528 RepID=A0A6H1ZGT1_9ZZZZ
MVNAYMKQLIVNGEGKFHVVRIGAEGEEALAVKRDIYLGDDWQDATVEEYDAQMASVEVPVEEVAEEAVAEEEAPVVEEVPV